MNKHVYILSHAVAKTRRLDGMRFCIQNVRIAIKNNKRNGRIRRKTTLFIIHGGGKHSEIFIGRNQARITENGIRLEFGFMRRSEKIRGRKD